MPMRLRLSCHALLIIVLVRLNFYSAQCLEFSSPFTLTEFIWWPPGLGPSTDLHFSFYSFPSNDPQLSWTPGIQPALIVVRQRPSTRKGLRSKSGKLSESWNVETRADDDGDCCHLLKTAGWHKINCAVQSVNRVLFLLLCGTWCVYFYT